ncbi:hypothetical protein ACS0TY_000407 [Phlomoides rotata]
MWTELICGLFIYRIVKRLFYADEALDLDFSRFDALFAVAKRLQKLYQGSKVYVGIQIPDFDSATRKNIDLVLVTNQEAMVISVKNLSGIVSIDRDNNWVCADRKSHKTERLPNPVDETRELVSILEQYLDQRGVALPEGYLSCKVICPNPKFGFIDSDLSPPEVITQLTQLKPEQRNLYSEWIKGALRGGKEKMQESFSEKLNFVLSTAPISDRLELEGNKCILGKFLEFKGAQDNIQLLRKIKRSKVSRLTIQKTSMFGFEVRVLSTPRDYRGAGSSSSSQRDEVIVKSYTDVVFQPQNSKKPHKYKLSSVMSISLSA